MILAVAVALSALTGAAAQSRSQTTAAWGERPLRKSPVNFAVKTNLLYTAISQTPNLGFEFGAGRRSTINIAGGYNPWNLDGLENEGANKKLVHWAVAAEYRYWLCEKFNGHFFGAHVLAGKYNIGGYELPLLFGEGSKAFRQEGSAAGAGVGYGYQWMLGTHWNLEAVLGVGYLQFKYDQYDCPKCGSKIGQVGRNYFGPTNMGVTVMYLF
jgi:hypothetical protein